MVGYLRTAQTFGTAHTFCASRDRPGNLSFQFKVDAY